MTTNRLFIALKLPDEIRDEIASIRDSVCALPGGMKWEPVEKLHLTLKFLGDTEESKNEEILEILNKISENYKEINCQYDRFGFFLPRILWVGLKVEGQLFEIVKRLNSDLQKLGFEPEGRNFKPHITLLRIKYEPNPEFVSSFKNFTLPPREFKAREISLVKSKLSPQGSVYADLKSFYLIQSEE
jgi:2'-5' RNA ligase